MTLLLAGTVSMQAVTPPDRIRIATCGGASQWTGLTVEAGPSSTRVRVYEGPVRVTRLVDGHAVEVPAGHQVIAHLVDWWCCTADQDSGFTIRDVELIPARPQLAALPEGEHR